MKNCIIDLAIDLPPDVEVLPATALPDFEIPLFSSAISAGFPSPAENYLDEAINLQQFLIKNAAATYLLRVRGNSMRDANINEGDILIVDRSVKPGIGQIIIGLLDNEFTVKRLIRKNNQYYLQPENPAYPTIPLPDDSQFQVWGVVTWCIHKISRTS